MHILKPIYSLLLDIYLRINRDYKSPQKSIAGFLYFFSPFFFSQRTQNWRWWWSVTVQLGTPCSLSQQVPCSFQWVLLQPQSYTRSKFLTIFFGFGGVEKKTTKNGDDDKKKKKGKRYRKSKLTHRGGEVTARQRKSVALARCYRRTSLCGRHFLTQGKTLCNAPLGKKKID